MSTAAKKLLTAEEFSRLPEPEDGSKQELVRGEVVTMPPPGFPHGRVHVNITFTLEGFLRDHDIGQLTVETGVITENGADSVRGPDVAFWSYETLPEDQSPVVYANVPADLVAEVISPGNTRKQIAKKLREYFASGVKLVWIVDPDDRTVTVYTKPGGGIVLWEDATLTGDAVLPGFSCPVAAFFRKVPR